MAPVVLSSLSCNPTSLTSGAGTTCTVHSKPGGSCRWHRGFAVQQQHTAASSGRYDHSPRGLGHNHLQRHRGQHPQQSERDTHRYPERRFADSHDQPDVATDAFLAVLQSHQFGLRERAQPAP